MSATSTSKRLRVNLVGLALLSQFFSTPAQGSPLLEQLIRHVVEQHPAVSMEADFERAAREEVAAADWLRYPSLSVHTEASGSRPVTQIRLEQLLWTGGRLEAQRSLAGSQETLQKAQTRDVQYQLALRVVDAWVALVQSEARLREVSNTLEQLSGYQALMRRRVDAEVSPRIELALIESRMLSAQVDASEARTARTLARNRLQQLVGSSSMQDWNRTNALELKTLAKSASAQMGTLRERLDQSTELHPSLIKAKEQAQIALHQMEIQQASRWPEVYIRAQHTSGSVAASRDPSLLIGLRYQPSAGLSSVAKWRAAAQRAEGQAFAVETVRRDLLDAAHTDLEELASAAHRVAAMELAVSTSIQVLESYERQFVAGRRSWQEVLNAVRENADHRIAVVDAHAAVLGSAYRLRVRLSDFDWQMLP